jgi:hypothetical protein
LSWWDDSHARLRIQQKMKELESVVWVMFRREEREERKGKGFWFSKLLI